MDLFGYISNVLSWDFVLLQSPPHDISRYFVICLLKVNEDHVQVLLLLPISLHQQNEKKKKFRRELIYVPDHLRQCDFCIARHPTSQNCGALAFSQEGLACHCIQPRIGEDLSRYQQRQLINISLGH